MAIMVPNKCYTKLEKVQALRFVVLCAEAQILYMSFALGDGVVST